MSRVKGVRWSRGQGARAGAAVKALVALSVVAYFLQESDPTVTFRFANVPYAVNNGEYYRLMTATFMHANISHLLLNMLGLWIIGSQLEPVLGEVRFVVLYLVAGIGGSVAYYALGEPLVPALGASTAVFGLFGAAFVIARSRRGDTRTIITLIAINLVFGFVVPGIDNWGHLGGLITGGVVAAIFELSEQWPDSARVAVQVGGVAVVLAAFALVVNQDRPQLPGRIESMVAVAPDGAHAADAVNATNGAAGANGANGANGTNGANGANGEVGRVGANGEVSRVSLAGTAGGGSRERRVAARPTGVGLPLWEVSQLVPPSTCRQLCRQDGAKT